MSSPQLENGYTRIANELLEKYAELRLCSSEYSVLLTVLRETYGWAGKKKTKDEIWREIKMDVFKLNRQEASRAIRRLVNRNIIERRKPNNSFIYRPQKDWTQWKKRSEIASEAKLPPNEKQNRSIKRSDNASLGVAQTVGDKGSANSLKKGKERNKESESPSALHELMVFWKKINLLMFPKVPFVLTKKHWRHMKDILQKCENHQLTAKAVLFSFFKERKNAKPKDYIVYNFNLQHCLGRTQYILQQLSLEDKLPKREKKIEVEIDETEEIDF